MLNEAEVLRVDWAAEWAALGFCYCRIQAVVVVAVVVISYFVSVDMCIRM